MKALFRTVTASFACVAALAAATPAQAADFGFDSGRPYVDRMINEMPCEQLQGVADRAGVARGTDYREAKDKIIAKGEMRDLVYNKMNDHLNQAPYGPLVNQETRQGLGNYGQFYAMKKAASCGVITDNDKMIDKDVEDAARSKGLGSSKGGAFGSAGFDFKNIFAGFSS